MGRPPSKPTRLKNGFYIEVKNPGSGTIILRRDTEQQMISAAKEYARTKLVNVLGEMKDDKWIN